MSLPAIVLAGALLGSGLAAPPEPDAIFGGTPTSSCEWPTVVRVGDCSGLLVHPEIVITAGHCPDVDEVVFGIDDDEAESIAVVECGDTGMHEPGEGLDLGWCRLETPRDDAALVPLFVGDDAAALRPGRAVRIVGYGLTEDGVFGVQHVVDTTIVELDGDYVKLGGDGHDSCIGDSGAPAFVELDDGQMYALALVSYGPLPCGAGGWYTRLDRGRPWLEAATGVDLTTKTSAVVSRCDDEVARGCAIATPGTPVLLVGLIAVRARARRRSTPR